MSALVRKDRGVTTKRCCCWIESTATNGRSERVPRRVQPRPSAPVRVPMFGKPSFLRGKQNPLFFCLRLLSNKEDIVGASSMAHTLLFSVLIRFNTNHFGPKGTPPTHSRIGLWAQDYGRLPLRMAWSFPRGKTLHYTVLSNDQWILPTHPEAMRR